MRNTLGLALPDEYQNGITAGSLVKARGCWLDLVAADALHRHQRFTFLFGCGTEGMARGLTDFLRYAEYAGFVRTVPRTGGPERGGWQVVGTTHATVWSLESMEHLFMRLRNAGARYESALVTLELLPLAPTRR